MFTFALYINPNLIRWIANNRISFFFSSPTLPSSSSLIELKMKKRSRYLLINIQVKLNICWIIIYTRNCCLWLTKRFSLASFFLPLSILAIAHVSPSAGNKQIFIIPSNFVSIRMTCTVLLLFFFSLLLSFCREKPYSIVFIIPFARENA